MSLNPRLRDYTVLYTVCISWTILRNILDSVIYPGQRHISRTASYIPDRTGESVISWTTWDIFLKTSRTLRTVGGEITGCPKHHGGKFSTWTWTAGGKFLR